MTIIPHIPPRPLYVAIALLLLLAVAAVFLPIRIPVNVSVFGRVLPAREWVLVRGPGGELLSLVRDNAAGAVEEYSVTEPLRGDATQFVLTPGIAAMERIDAGDTVGWMISPELSRELTALEGALDVARAALTSARAGEKPALVRQARGAVAQARAAQEEQQHLLARQEELHRRKTISDEEYQLSVDRLDVLRAGVEVAEAQLAAVTSGLKPEDVLQREREAGAIEAELRALRARLSRFTHTAPIGGTLRNAFAPDTLLAVMDADALLLVLPVPVDECKRLDDDAEIRFDIPRTDIRGSARILRRGRDAMYVQGEPVCMIVAEVTEGGEGLRAGLIARASLSGRSLRAAEFLERLWTSISR